jgi:hypothetical protein
MEMLEFRGTSLAAILVFTLTGLHSLCCLKTTIRPPSCSHHTSSPQHIQTLPLIRPYDTHPLDTFFSKRNTTHPLNGSYKRSSPPSHRNADQLSLAARKLRPWKAPASRSAPSSSTATTRSPHHRRLVNLPFARREGQPALQESRHQPYAEAEHSCPHRPSTHRAQHA